jgi:hypothetical protein
MFKHDVPTQGTARVMVGAKGRRAPQEEQRGRVSSVGNTRERRGGATDTREAKRK